MKSLVVYRSLSGFTKRYAEWIAEELVSDIREVKDVNVDYLLNYDVVIFGGSLHAVGINGVNIIKNNLPKLSGKKIVVFAVGASPPRDKILDEVKDRNFSPDEQKVIRFYYLPGGFDYNKLDFVNKVLMTLLKWKIILKSDRTSDEKGMLVAYSRPMDFARKENLKELVEYVNSLG